MRELRREDRQGRRAVRFLVGRPAARGLDLFKVGARKLIIPRLEACIPVVGVHTRREDRAAAKQNRPEAAVTVSYRGLPTPSVISQHFLGVRICARL